VFKFCALNTITPPTELFARKVDSLNIDWAYAVVTRSTRSLPQDHSHSTSTIGSLLDLGLITLQLPPCHIE
jgi:hypothetical protein